MKLFYFRNSFAEEKNLFTKLYVQDFYMLFGFIACTCVAFTYYYSTVLLSRKNWTLHRTNNAERQFNGVMIVSHYSECVLVFFFFIIFLYRFVECTKFCYTCFYTECYGIPTTTAITVERYLYTFYCPFWNSVEAYSEMLVLFLGASLFGNAAENLMAWFCKTSLQPR